MTGGADQHFLLRARVSSPPTMVAMRPLVPVLLVLLVAGCTPGYLERAYFADPSAPSTAQLSHTLYRAAQAAGEDPAQYSFVMIRSRHVAAYHTDDGVFYFTDGLARQLALHVDALVAHEFAHQLLGHAGRRAAVSLGTSGGFTVLGLLVPGLSLADLIINPLIVRAFSRDQEIAADLKAVDLIQAMGHETPRRTLAEALRAAAAINGPTPGGWFATEPPLEQRLAVLEPLEPERTARSGGPQRSR